MRDTAEGLLVLLMLLLVCWLFADSSQGKVMQTVGRQAGGSCSAGHSLAQPGASAGQRQGRARPHQAWPVHWCASHAVTLLLREEKERQQSDGTVC